MKTTIRAILAVAVLATAGCASAGTGPGCVFCGAQEGYIRGYHTSKGDRQEGGQFVERDQVRRISGPAHVIGYFNSIMYCNDGPWVQGFDQSTIYAGKGCHARAFDNATIYYRDGATVKVDEFGRAFKCPGSQYEPWDKSKCVRTH